MCGSGTTCARSVRSPSLKMVRYVALFDVVARSRVDCASRCWRDERCVSYVIQDQGGPGRKRAGKVTCRGLTVDADRLWTEEYPVLQHYDMQGRMETATSCINAENAGQRDGLFLLQMGRGGFITVCQAGWTVIQRRQDGQTDFNRTWNSYARGFGDPRANFWLGLHKLYALTQPTQSLQVRVDLLDCVGSVASVTYPACTLGPQSKRFQLDLGKSLEGTAGDCLLQASLSKTPFSTSDSNNGLPCAGDRGAGWWYDNVNCNVGNPNAGPLDTACPTWNHAGNVTLVQVKVKPADLLNSSGPERNIS